MHVGLLDDSSTLYGNPDTRSRSSRSSASQVIRVDLYWGGAQYRRREAPPTNAQGSRRSRVRLVALRPARELRRAVRDQAPLHGLGRRRAGRTAARRARYAPKNFTDLRNFAYAAAKRYSGTRIAEDGVRCRRCASGRRGTSRTSSFQLSPQYKNVRGKYVMHERDQLREDLHRDLHRRPRDAAEGREGRVRRHRSAAATTTRDGKRRLADADVVHGGREEGGPEEVRRVGAQPVRTAPREHADDEAASQGSRTLGNLDDLIKQLRKLWGRKRLWLTEYGYQTNPPDKTFGVSYSKQALYLKQAYAIARKNPRVDMMLWFQLKDEPGIGGWQSGLMTTRGKKKPAFTAFARLPH